MIAAVARMVFPFAIAVAIALWLKGYAHAGDGFSAGAVAGLGAFVQYVCVPHEEARRRTGATFVPRGIALGVLVILALFFGPMLAGLPPVTHFPRPSAHVVSIGAAELHTALVFDAATMVIVYGAFVAIVDRLLPHFHRGAP